MFYARSLNLNVFAINVMDVFILICAYFGVTLCLRMPVSIPLIHDVQQDAKNKDKC